MLLLRSLPAFAVLACTALAQVNPFVLYPQDPERQTITCTSFVGRPDGNRAAEALVKFDRSWCQGLGEYTGLQALLFGVYHWVADENLSTSETYDLVVRDEDPQTGLPSLLSAPWVIQGLTTPPSPNPQRGTWIMYDGFGIQGGIGVSTLNNSGLFVGVALRANPQWPATDGHSLFRADMLNANTGATVGENHRPGAPNPTWTVPANGAPFSTPWSYLLGPFVVSANLHVGGIDPTSNRLGAPGANYGMGGRCPDLTAPRSDGLTVRFTDNLAPFGLVALGACLGFDGPHYYTYPRNGGFTSIFGASYIGQGSNTISLLVSTLQNGLRETTVAMPGTIPPALVGSMLVFQGFVWDVNTDVSNWSNAQAVRF